MPKPTNNAPWAPFARTILRRLHAAEDDSSFDLDIDMDGDTIAPRCKRTPPGVIELFDAMDSTQKHDPHDLDAMRAAGVDGVALDDRGSDRPPHTIAAGKILMALRLAATFGREEHFLKALEPRAVTVLEGIDPAQLSGAATSIGRLFVPEGWTSHTRAPRHKDTGVLQLLRPMESGARKISEQAIAKIEQEILTALTLPHPLLILLPKTTLLPPGLRRVLPPSRRLAPIDRDLMLKLLGQTHSSTGKIDAALVRPLLPDDKVLATLDMPSLMSALREPDASAVARKLTALLAPTANTSSDMTLEEIGGDTPAHQAAQDLVTDLAAWRRGDAQWTELSTSLLLEGEPGSGKTLLARAIAASARVPLIEGSFGVWQSGGHLGDMLREMRRSFAEAASKRPCVLFVDEVDAAGSRESQDRHAENYRRQVVNQFLQEIDSLRRSEGVLLIGATNHRHALDPAILRPGRFDLHHCLGRPTRTQVLHMLRRSLPDVKEPDLAMLARTFSGETPAMIDATIRAAKAQARRLGRPLTVPTLMADRPPAPEGYVHRVALHECGHALTATLLGAGPVRRMQLSRDGGSTSRGSAIQEGTPLEFENELTIILAGRASERLTLGSISAGAGGSVESDLAQASALQLQFDREFGLGVNGNAWIGPPDMKQLSPEDWTRLRVKLDQFERRARALLAPHRDLLETLAAHLVEHRELQESDLRPWLSGLQPADHAETGLNGDPSE